MAAGCDCDSGVFFFISVLLYALFISRFLLDWFT